MRLFSKADKNSKTPSINKDDAPPASSRSPRKKSTSSESSRSTDKNSKPEQGSPRSSRRFPKSSSSRHAPDPDTHPLNLPLDQLQKRLSALSAMSDSMDIDTEGQSNMPGSFETPKANGTNGIHADGDGEAPDPPPHKS